MNLLYARTLLCLAGLPCSLAGCQLDLDADVIRNEGSSGNMPDAGDDECPQGFVCTPVEPSMVDGGDMGLGDAGPGFGDAGPEGPPDAEVDAGQGDAEVPQVCSNDDQCPAASFCSVGGVCVDRCQEGVGCAITGVLGDVESMLVEGDRIYWSLPNTLDTAGNPLANGSIWLKDGAADPVAISTMVYTPKLELIADGFVYFVETDRGPSLDVQRVATAAGALPEKLNWQSGPVHSVWTTDAYLWWARTVDSPPVNGTITASQELWRRPRAASGPDERVLVRTHDQPEPVYSYAYRWLIGNDRHAAYQAEDGLLSVQAFDGSAARAFSSGTYFVDLLIDDRYLVTTAFLTSYLERIDITTGEAIYLRPLPPDPAGSYPSTKIVRRGPWVFWFDVNSFASRVGRSHIDLAVPLQELQTLPMAVLPMAGGGFAPFSDPAVGLNALGTLLYYVHSPERRLFKIELPPSPCSETLPCLNGLTCQADQLCR